MLPLRRPVLALCTLALPMTGAAGAQGVADGSDAAIGKPAVGQRFGDLDPKVTVLRRAGGGWICGSVNVKNRDGLSLGECGFVSDVSDGFFGRVPEGPELLNPRAPGMQALEQIRHLSFSLSLAACAWQPVLGSLCLAACAWQPVPGSLCLD